MAQTYKSVHVHLNKQETKMLEYLMENNESSQSQIFKHGLRFYYYQLKKDQESQKDIK